MTQSSTKWNKQKTEPGSNGGGKSTGDRRTEGERQKKHFLQHCTIFCKRKKHTEEGMTMEGEKWECMVQKEGNSYPLPPKKGFGGSLDDIYVWIKMGGGGGAGGWFEYLQKHPTLQ